jgi:single-strand DNA-binding protein
MARFTIAVDRRWVKNENDQKADFINCLSIGKLGEHVEKYYHKGLKVALSGRMQTGSYTNKDGQKVYTTELFVEEQEFAESKAASGSAQAAPAPAYNQQAAGSYQQAPAPAPAPAKAQETTAQEWENYFGSAFGEELPFT